MPDVSLAFLGCKVWLGGDHVCVLFISAHRVRSKYILNDSELPEG